MPLAVILLFVEDTTGADLLIDYGGRLKSVGEDDIWVHGCHIYVVDKWLLFVERTSLLDEFEFFNYLSLNLGVVCH
jgi:hypothetical protein